MKILFSAYACEPGTGSEPGVGWNWALEMSRIHETWVLTRPCYRDAIQASIRAQPLPTVHWLYFDLPHWVRWWNKNDRGIHVHYYLWQIGAYFVGRRLSRQVDFDLVHHATNACYWMPSFLALLPVPFVWGPVGGGESIPPGFWNTLSPRGKLHEILRNTAQALGRLDPFVRMTARRALLGLATTVETQERIRALGCRRTLVFPTIGLSAGERRLLNTLVIRHHNPFRVISIGNLLHLKGFDLGLRAFSTFQTIFPASEYWIIGEGPEEQRLKTLARHLGVSNKVIFFGRLPRPQALGKLAECDVLLHPSLHDSGGWVCLEAMAAGRPVVCLDRGGPALLVAEEAGFKIPATTPDHVVRGLADALYKLASDHGLRSRLSIGARKQVEEYFSWEKKASFMSTLYECSPTSEKAMSARCADLTY